MAPRKPEFVKIEKAAREVGKTTKTLRRWRDRGFLEIRKSPPGAPRASLVDLNVVRALIESPPIALDSPAEPPPPGDVRPVRLLLLEEAAAIFGKSVEEVESMGREKRIAMWMRIDDGTKYVEYESARRELAD